MKKSSKIQFVLSFALALSFGIFLGLSPQNVYAEEELPAPSCFHNVSGSSGATNFCEVNTCKVLTGVGSLFGLCGGV